jgi:hypothetical protein
MERVQLEQERMRFDPYPASGRPGLNRAREEVRERQELERVLRACGYERDNSVMLSYFVQADGTDRVKIGQSGSIKQRVRSLQTQSPIPLTLLFVTRMSEAVLHDYFAESRLHGEWFRITPTLEAMIAYGLRHGDLPPRNKWEALALSHRPNLNQGEPMPSVRQNDDFIAELISAAPLDTAIEWIKGNLSPDDVFDEDQLAAHARSNIEIDDVYSERNILDYVTGTFNPEDVFSARQLEAWASENGFVKE